ncbi:MAG: exo-beta-N-acetylmuramidase NamZ domain-containing protein [Terriglobales bacterium]
MPAKKPAARAAAAASSRFAPLDAMFKKAVADEKIPGAVVLVGHNGHVVYRKAFGYRALEPKREKMTLDTIFDMASLTKCLATTVSMMRLIQLGQVRLNDPVAKFIPEFGANGKQQITIRELMTHTSGLAPDLDLKTPWQGYDTALKMAYDGPPMYTPGSRFVYSDINFEVLGELVHRVSGMMLDQYALAHIYEPLHMTHTRFLPPKAWLPKIAPTQYVNPGVALDVALEGKDRHGTLLRGIVHDPTARRMGGVAGHAGLFSTGDDVAKFAQAMLDGGGPVLSPLTVEKMITPETPPTMPNVRALGWDIDTPFSTNRGDFLPVGSYGHTGFTGTSLWIDPTTNTYIIILCNAVHPVGSTGEIISLRTRAATAVAAALHLTFTEKEKLRLEQITGYNEVMSSQRRFAIRNGKVKTGLDVLEERNFDTLKRADGKTMRIGLVTNQSGIDAQGRRNIDVLAHAPGVELTAIFSPEHGVTGSVDTTDIGNTVDSATKIPVYSVYGDTAEKRHPPMDVLKNLDAVVYDIQDAGVRFYTYETTLGYFLEATAKAGIDMIVLDRPDPITGSFVQGPMSEPGTESFVNYTSEPVRQGMTTGELAKFFNGERHIGAKLTVVPMEGWVRGDWFDSTGLMWINPSPNLRNLIEETLYPGVCLVEGTNVSVGRGTDTPFEIIGAPWIDGKQLSDYLNAREIQGVRFVPITFTPEAGSKLGGQKLGGVNIVLLNRDFFDAPEMGIELASALHALYPNQFDMKRMHLLVGSQKIVDEITSGVDPRNIAAEWQEPLKAFMAVRKKYLIY